MGTGFLLSLATLLLSFLFVHAQNPPEVKINRFENLPAKLYFFDDATYVAYHDPIRRDLYVSSDEGKNWQRVTDIPQGKTSLFIEHPFNNRMAFVLTQGTTHYRTEDRGQSWRSFEVPIPPSYVARPLSFHSDSSKYGYIIYQGTKCEREGGWSSMCHDETYYTKEAFSDDPKLLLSETSQCSFAHSSKDFKHEAHADLIYCVGFDTTSSTGYHSISSSRLFSSTDFFTSEKRIEDLGINRGARGIVAFAIVSKYAVVALKDLSGAAGSEMLLYVTVDTRTWAQAQFPHASSARLRENAYTILQSTTHSLAVDVVLNDSGAVGTLFVSNSNGTYFVESLKDTNRNEVGFIDYETLYGVDGVGLANIVANAQDVEGRDVSKELKTLITFDDGSSWSPLRPPSEDSEGHRISCDASDADSCSLHLHSVTIPHNFGRIFSSPAPGFVMGVGSIGGALRPYEESDTFLSTDAGVTWSMVRRDAHKYEFGDQGGIIVAVNDEETVDFVIYSTDLGKTWKTLQLGVHIRARALSTVQDSTSQKFLLLGQLSRQDATDEGRVASIFIDFAPMGRRKCGDDDFERWYARTAKNKECLMGHKQWYRRRKLGADCYVGDKFSDPVEHEEDCPCQDEDYECDYNYVRHGSSCVPVGPEPIPAGVCKNPDQTYEGSSGYRIIPGNTCDRNKGAKKDDPIKKKCSQAQPEEGNVIHQTFEFPAPIVQHAYFKESTTILVRLEDASVWQSSNEGYTWDRLFPDETFLAFYHHTFTPDRAYLITSTAKFFYTTDTGRSWNYQNAPKPPNTFGAQVLHFHPEHSDWIIWTGDEGCGGGGNNCHAEAHYSRDNGRRWALVETYVRNCAWARDKGLLVDPSQILCESFRDKTGSQRFFQMGTNPLQLVGGSNFFAKKSKIFDEIVGFTKFSEYLIVAEYLPEQRSLDLQVSLDGHHFATGQFPPTMRPEQHAYTVLESSTDSIFLHMTTSEPPRPYWGTILKSNWNGTYFGASVENVNRDQRGFVDFEKMIGLDGIALINVIANPEAAAVTGTKELQTRITHNDGGSWKPLNPPKYDSHGQAYDCRSASCALHVHGYTERFDPRATFSSPSVVGLLMAVGNVGEKLAPYAESDTFLSRDAGFTWEEVHKDAHLWEFGDSGSILVMANDEEPTDHVLFTTDEGLSWREYKFSDEKIRVRSIVTVPSDTSRRFILLGAYGRSLAAVAVHIDFSSLTSLQCKLDIEDPGHDDFELWSPSEERSERCLFGRQTLYHRRRRDRNCVVGTQPKAKENIVKNCPCMDSDFECEFNHVRNADGKCVLVEGTQPRPDDDSCRGGEQYWYERTAYQRIPHSTCEDGERPDRGRRHLCPGVAAHGPFFWLFVLLVPFAFTTLVAMWYYKRSGLATGTIRLPGSDVRPRFGASDAGFVETLASVPWFIVGVAAVAFEAVAEWARGATLSLRTQRGYRNVPVDEDAQILRFADEEE
ncbi:Oligoxyloglucan reducing end-specific cellobiohydrolase [Lactarius akahatsu]|uniref:Vacuolar protein sorting/targeting protein 10 n=1 Tax=Lactarius akahatsu TaxID=416441 RepID=A0AAD4LB06_9AGAM|nr:Oligoxyloglucan reducing end-specific cellobiohydrolase [Lactarius akahatsu]KAH8985020.1 Oligoxyloglucan reducing end-specific cellobiohydrolase [Lactarius akahatsu]